MSVSEQRELREYLQVLDRRKVLILVVTAVVTVGSLGVALLQTPVYRATAELLFESGSARLIVNPASQRVGDPQRLLENEVQFLESEIVSDAAEAKIGLDGDISVVVSQPTGDIMFVSAADTDPEDAAAIVNAHAEAYIEERREQGVEDYQNTIDVVEENLEDVRRTQFESQARIGELNSLLADPADDADIGLLTAERNALQANQSNLFDQTIRLEANLRELRLGLDLSATEVASITKPAVPPESPVSPQPIRNAAVGLVVGLVLGVGAAFVRDYLDDRLSSADLLEVFLRNRLPILAQVPDYGDWDDDDGTTLISIDEPHAAAAEAYRSLRTAISFLDFDVEPCVIQVTSPEAGDGKSTTAANLAVAMARAGHEVLIVDADLRRAALHEVFGLRSKPGLVAALRTGSLDGTIRAVADVPNLDLLPAGGLPPDPSELIASDAIDETFSVLRDRYDLVVVDSPPMLAVSDTMALTRVADAVTVVVNAQATTTRTLGQALETAEQVAAPLVGVVLNRSSETQQYYEPYQPAPSETVVFDAVDDIGGEDGSADAADGEAREDETEPVVS